MEPTAKIRLMSANLIRVKTREDAKTYSTPSNAIANRVTKETYVNIRQVKIFTNTRVSAKPLGNQCKKWSKIFFTFVYLVMYDFIVVKM